MGGVPALLMMAAVGITFGWQPDDHGGVEYIIQIPPEQVHHLEQVGEISSRIDPAVRGHVSRVIIRVGNSTPPKIAPSNLTRTGSRHSVAGSVIPASDSSPVPIPEMEYDAGAIPSLDSTAAKSLKLNQAAVLKPDANDPPGSSGFGFPSVPSSLRDTAARTAEGIRANVDRAGRDLGARASGQMNAVTQDVSAALRKSLEDARNGKLVAPPATRTPNPPALSQAPPLGGSDPRGAMARVRPGGPSTDPTSPRDNSWRDFVGPRRPNASTEPVGPSGLDANNPFHNRRVDAPAPSTDSLSNRPAANGHAVNGLVPRDTFGKMPGGLSMPSAGGDPRAGYAGRNTTADRNSRLSPQTGRQEGVYSPYAQSRLDRQSEYAAADRAAQQRDDHAAHGGRGLDRGYDPGRSGGYDPRGYDPRDYDPSGGRDQQMSQPGANPDSRLTAAQIAAGAWTVDVHGRAIDRQGRLIEPTYSPSTATGAYNQPQTPLAQTRTPSGHYADRTSSSLGEPYPYRPTSPATAPGNVPGTVGQRAYEPNATWPSKVASNVETGDVRRTIPSGGSQGYAPSDRDTAQRDAAITRRQDPPSLADRRSPAIVTAVDSSRRPVAPQPLFSGLLLISFVANVYLIFWLKNLRIQFRDLVAAKRMANSNSVQ